MRSMTTPTVVTTVAVAARATATATATTRSGRRWRRCAARAAARVEDWCGKTADGTTMRRASARPGTSVRASSSVMRSGRATAASVAMRWRVVARAGADVEGAYADEAEAEEVDALLREIFEEAGVEATWTALGEDEDVEISGVANDINALLSGDLFVNAERGEAGAATAREAVAAGAVAVVSSEPIDGLADVPVVIVENVDEALADIARVFYGDPSKALTAIALTGTAGKTTTSYLVKSVFEEANIRIGVAGSNGNFIEEDLKLTAQGGVWESDEEDSTRNRACTAPGWLAPYRGKYEFEELGSDALQFQQITAGMADNGAQAAVLEVNAEQIRRKATRGMSFDIVALTSIEGEPSNYHGLESEYPAHVAEPFKSLTDAETQRAVINVDSLDFGPREMAHAADLCRENAAGVPVVTYSSEIGNTKADVYPARVDLSLFETAISLSTPAGNVEVVVGLVGEHMVGAICCATAIGLAAEIPLDVIAAGLEAIEVVPGRMELVDAGQDFSVLVDSANTPESIERVLRSVRATNCRRVITLIGCEGESENPGQRAVIGKTVHDMSDVVFITNDSPKSEDPYKILDDICIGFRDNVYDGDVRTRDEALFAFLKDMYKVHENAQYECMRLQNLVRRYVMVDRYHAIRAAIGMAEPNDAVLILGRGAKDYFVVGREKHWFEDVLEARDALTKIGAIQDSGVDTHNLPWQSFAARATNPGAGNLLD